jgi:hypothetical protein
VNGAAILPVVAPLHHRRDAQLVPTGMTPKRGTLPGKGHAFAAIPPGIYFIRFI